MFAALMLSVFQVEAPKPPLPKAEANKLGQLLADALADPKATSKALAAVKGWQAKYEWDSLVAALRAGPRLDKGAPKARGKGKRAEQIETFGNVLYGFTFEYDGVVYRYGVDVPAKYESDRPAPLLIDPGHGTGADKDTRGKADFLPFYRGQADRAGLEHALIARTEIIEQIGVGGQRGAKPEEYTGAVFDAFFRDLTSRFAVDLDRVMVAGLSQTGFWAWELGHQRADRFAGIAPMSAVSVQQARYLENFLGLSVFVLHGDVDGVCPVAQPRATCKELERLGVRTRYVEVAGAGHDVAVWARLNEGLVWIGEKPRERYPKRVAKALQTTAQPWCYWVRVDELEKEGSGEAAGTVAGSVVGEVEDQTVRITSKGVKKVSVALAREMLDLSRVVIVEWNGKRVFEGRVERSFVKCVEVAIEKVDWSATFEAVMEF